MKMATEMEMGMLTVTDTMEMDYRLVNILLKVLLNENDSYESHVRLSCFTLQIT